MTCASNPTRPDGTDTGRSAGDPRRRARSCTGSNGDAFGAPPSAMAANRQAAAPTMTSTLGAHARPPDATWSTTSGLRTLDGVPGSRPGARPDRNARTTDADSASDDPAGANLPERDAPRAGRQEPQQDHVRRDPEPLGQALDGPGRAADLPDRAQEVVERHQQLGRRLVAQALELGPDGRVVEAGQVLRLPAEALQQQRVPDLVGDREALAAGRVGGP